MSRLFALTILSVLIGTTPILVFAQDSRLYAGTDQYLREVVGLTDEQLSTKVNTIDREAFDLATGEQSIADPLGDVLHHEGVTSEIQIPWGDIRAVDFFRNEETETWDITITTGGLIPEDPPGKAQFLVYADRDGDASNNEPDGIKINVDAEFSVEYEVKESRWITDFRWYNPDPVDFWAVNVDTELTYEFDADTISIHIPYEELPTDFDPNWRVVIAVTDNGQTQVDTVPGIGYPPPKGETYPEAEFISPEDRQKQSILYGLIGLGGAILLFSLWRSRKPKTK